MQMAKISNYLPTYLDKMVVLVISFSPKTAVFQPGEGVLQSLSDFEKENCRCPNHKYFNKLIVFLPESCVLLDKGKRSRLVFRMLIYPLSSSISQEAGGFHHPFEDINI